MPTALSGSHSICLNLVPFPHTGQTRGVTPSPWPHYVTLPSPLHTRLCTHDPTALMAGAP